ncbi:glucose-6-phosphate isomerase [Roseibacterium sp. SDUM158016]|uniref:glycine zipper 2TM domain-containing protein n=1 Tax=Roseicyclus sediminis TaxID=2980997 RepID=UPI0021D3D87C|nr:glucose-6-phosphate isomerase [Roseibacterium sp. SDUM158016]MCU4653649.1 glucose-6-phosphate isomerase [Roseibacterium sp. SDUM158016]
MHRVTVSALFAAVLALAGCQNMTQQDQSELFGAALGAGAGLLLADAFDANPQWTVVTALAGAAVGQQVARNNSTGECAYYVGRDSLGRPVYRTGPC